MFLFNLFWLVHSHLSPHTIFCYTTNSIPLILELPFSPFQFCFQIFILIFILFNRLFIRVTRTTVWWWFFHTVVDFLDNFFVKLHKSFSRFSPCIIILPFVIWNIFLEHFQLFVKFTIDLRVIIILWSFAFLVASVFERRNRSSHFWGWPLRFLSQAVNILHSLFVSGVLLFRVLLFFQVTSLLET